MAVATATKLIQRALPCRHSSVSRHWTINSQPRRVPLLLDSFTISFSRRNTTAANCWALIEQDLAKRLYFAVFFFLTTASRSVFLRRLARLFTLSLPLLCPIESTFDGLSCRSNGTERRAASARLLLPRRSRRYRRGRLPFCLCFLRAEERRPTD